jgi:hypothetical protein
MERLVSTLTGTYQAVDDAGRVYVINIFTRGSEITLLHGEIARPAGGLQVHRLTDGSEVRVDSDGTLTVLRTGVKLRRVDAP